MPSSQIGSAWEWYHWIGLEMDFNCYRFLIFDFWSWIFDKSSKVLRRFMQKWIQPPTCLDHGLHVLKPRYFPPNRAPKMRERHQLFFGLWLLKRIPTFRNQTKVEQHFGGFFPQIKVRQSIGRQVSMQTVISTSRRLDSFLHEVAQNFEVFSNIQEWCPFQGLSNGTNLM